MNLKSEKGSILAIAIFFTIISAITSIGMYQYAYHVTREAAVQEPASMRGYYAAIAGLRYAYILLKDPAANFGLDGIGHSGHDGETATIIMNKDQGALKDDLGLIGDDELTITVTEWSSGVTDPSWANGNYKLTAEFRS